MRMKLSHRDSFIPDKKEDTEMRLTREEALRINYCQKCGAKMAALGGQ